RPLGAGVGDDSDLVLGPESDHLEAKRDLADDRPQLLEVDVHPLVADLVALRGEPGVLARGKQDEVGKRSRPRGHGARRDRGLNLHLFLHSQTLARSCRRGPARRILTWPRLRRPEPSAGFLPCPSGRRGTRSCRSFPERLAPPSPCTWRCPPGGPFPPLWPARWASGDSPKRSPLSR